MNNLRAIQNQKQIKTINVPSINSRQQNRLRTDKNTLQEQQSTGQNPEPLIETKDADPNFDPDRFIRPTNLNYHGGNNKVILSKGIGSRPFD